ncbi:MAG: hypothetical protein ACOY90_06495 [Candidatus Zhuqueibacterota bacterium]
MSVNFSAERWEKIIRDCEKWWQGTLGRPLIQIRLKGRQPDRDEPSLPYFEFTSFYDETISAEHIIDRIDFKLAGVTFMGDAFPHFWPNFGPGVIAAFLGCPLKNGVDTVWFQPETTPDIHSLSFRFDPDNFWFRRICDILRAAQERWGNRVQLGLTDLGGNLDILSSFRPSESLLLDLYDHPDQVRRLTWEAHQVWWDYFEAFNEIQGATNPGTTAWAPIFSPGRYYMLQCDFSYMISPAMFDTFVKPELDATIARLDHPFYHLDGIGELPHLDALLQMPKLKGIQWVPGDGKPDVSRWPEIYRKISEAGKLTQFFSSQYHGNPFELLDVLQRQLGAVDNMVYMIDAPISQQREAEKLLERYGFS